MRKGDSYQRNIYRVVVLMIVTLSHVSIDETVTPDLTDIPKGPSGRQNVRAPHCSRSMIELPRQELASLPDRSPRGLDSSVEDDELSMMRAVKLPSL